MSKQIPDKTFVLKNREILANACYKNANQLISEAWLMIEHEYYARATFLCISAFEEFVKYSMLSQNKVDINDLNKLVDHKLKAPEIVRHIDMLILEEAGIKIGLDQKKFADRIPKMREDSLYVRLKDTLENSYCPDDTYWKKRALSLYNFLNLYKRRNVKLDAWIDKNVKII